MEESPHVVFDEYDARLARKEFVDDIVDSMEKIHLDDDQEETPEETNSIEGEQHDEGDHGQQHDEEQPRELRISKNHPLENVIGDIRQGVTTRNSLRNTMNYAAFVSQVEPTNVSEAIEDDIGS